VSPAPTVDPLAECVVDEQEQAVVPGITFTLAAIGVTIALLAGVARGGASTPRSRATS